MTAEAVSRPDSVGIAPARPVGRVRLRTLVNIRWLAVAGQATAILLLRYGVEYHLPLLAAFTVVAASVLLNLFLGVRYPASTRLSDHEAAYYLTYDTLQLAALLYFTGGLTNPFAVLFLAPVAVSATVLSLRATLGVGVVSVVAMTVLVIWHYPLPWDVPGLELPTLYLWGQWAAVALGVAFLSIYLWSVAAESRRMSDALVETHMALAREHQISALGGLAAAAAHELGTPLGTITVAAKEMARMVPEGSDLAGDVALIQREAARCREILGRIASGPASESHHAFPHLNLADLIRRAGDAHHRHGVEIGVEAPEAAERFLVARRPEIFHGLNNIVENAVDFARSRVVIQAEVRDAEIRIRVLDDGPGFAHDILSTIGEPYVSTRSDGGGLGLGVFIAKTLLERTGAAMTVANRREGGAQVEIAWPRAALEQGQDRG